METKASFCTYYNKTLFVGEFFYPCILTRITLGYFGKYSTDKSHCVEDRNGVKKRAWVCGYEIDKGFKVPTSILSIPDKTQGIHIT